MIIMPRLRISREEIQSSIPGWGIFFCLPALEVTKPVIQWVHRALLSGLERLWYEADHWPPSSAEKNEWSYNVTPPYISKKWFLVMGKGNFFYIHNIIRKVYTRIQ